MRKKEKRNSTNQTKPRKYNYKRILGNLFKII